MAKRKKEPDEVIDPVLNGLETEFDFSLPEPAPDMENIPEPMLDGESTEEMENPVLLVFGDNGDAEAVGTLASGCGFEARAVLKGLHLEEPAWATQTHLLEDFENIEEACGLERNFFVCILEESPEDCELLLSQCLASDASYIGITGDVVKLSQVFEELRRDGVPDAELAAVAAPMGLNIGAKTPEQRAVAIMAEMLAARAGKLKRLRQGHKKV